MPLPPPCRSVVAAGAVTRPCLGRLQAAHSVRSTAQPPVVAEAPALVSVAATVSRSRNLALARRPGTHRPARSFIQEPFDRPPFFALRWELPSRGELRTHRARRPPLVLEQRLLSKLEETCLYTPRRLSLPRPANFSPTTGAFAAATIAAYHLCGGCGRWPRSPRLPTPPARPACFAPPCPAPPRPATRACACAIPSVLRRYGRCRRQGSAGRPAARPR